MTNDKMKRNGTDLAAENQGLMMGIACLSEATAEAERAKSEYMQNVARQLSRAHKRNQNACEPGRASAALLLDEEFHPPDGR